MKHQPQDHGRAEYVHVFARGNQIEISKFDEEARQDYVLIIPEKGDARNSVESSNSRVTHSTTPFFA